MTQDKANRLPCRETGSSAFVGRGFKHLQFTTKQTDFNIDDYFGPADPFALDASYRPLLELGMTLADIDERVAAGFSLQQIAANEPLVMGTLWWACWSRTSSPARPVAVQPLPSEKPGGSAPIGTPLCNTGSQNTSVSEARHLGPQRSEAVPKNTTKATLLPSGMYDAFEMYGCPPPAPVPPPVVPSPFDTPQSLPLGVGGPSDTPKSGMVLDFLNMTYLLESDDLLLSLKASLGDDWLDMEKGLYGYLCGARCGHITLLWAGSSDGMGIHVQLSGQGCRELEGRHFASYGAALDWRWWLQQRVKQGAKFTQTHFAFDDLDGRVSIDKLTAAFHAGETVTRFNRFKPVEEYGQDRTRIAHGMNFGERSKDTSITCYDKQLERMQKGMGIETEAYMAKVAALEQGWTRVELRNRNKRAQALVERIIEEGWSAVSAVLRGYLDVRRLADGSHESNKTRWEVAPWWHDFCSWADKARLVVEGSPKVLQSTMSWVDKQVGTALAMIVTVMPDGIGFLRDVVERGAERFGKRHLNMMSEYLKASQVAVKSASLYPEAPA